MAIVEAQGVQYIIDPTPVDDEGVLTLIELDSKHPDIITANTQLQKFVLGSANAICAEAAELERKSRQRLQEKRGGGGGGCEGVLSAAAPPTLEEIAETAASVYEENRQQLADQMKQCRVLLDACNRLVFDLDNVDFASMKVIWGDERSVRQSRRHLTQLIEKITDKLEGVNRFLKTVSSRLPSLASSPSPVSSLASAGNNSSGTDKNGPSPATTSFSASVSSYTYAPVGVSEQQGRTSPHKAVSSAERGGSEEEREEDHGGPAPSSQHRDMSSSEAQAGGREHSSEGVPVGGGLTAGNLLDEEPRDERGAGRGRGRGGGVPPGSGRGRGLLLPSRGRSRGALAGGGRGRGGLGAGEGPPSSDSSDASSGSDHEREANSNAGQLSRDGVDGPEETAYSAGGGAGSSGGRTEKKRGREEEEADEDKYDRWGNKRWKRKPASNVDWLLKCRTKLCELKERTMRKAVSDVFIKNRTVQETIDFMDHNLKKLQIVADKPRSDITPEDRRVFMQSIESYIAGLDKACALIAKQAMNKRQLMNLHESACKIEKLQTPSELVEEMSEVLIAEDHVVAVAREVLAARKEKHDLALADIRLHATEQRQRLRLGPIVSDVQPRKE